MLLILALRKLRQVDLCEFKGYIEKHYLEKPKKEKNERRKEGGGGEGGGEGKRGGREEKM